MAGIRRVAKVALGVLVGIATTVAVAQDLARTPGRWVDDGGRPFDLASLYGRPTVMTMSVGACRRVCSTSLRMLEQLQALADARGVSMNFVVVGLDPQQDRPADWAAYRRAQRLERANWFFLSSSEEAVAALAARLRVRHWRYGDHVMHDLRLVLLSEHAVPLRGLDRFDADLAALLP